MKLKNKRGYYISNSRINAMLFEKGEENLEDCFWFENPKDISKERYKEYMYGIKKETKKAKKRVSGMQARGTSIPVY